MDNFEINTTQIQLIALELIIESPWQGRLMSIIDLENSSGNLPTCILPIFRQSFINHLLRLCNSERSRRIERFFVIPLLSVLQLPTL